MSNVITNVFAIIDDNGYVIDEVAFFDEEDMLNLPDNYLKPNYEKVLYTPKWDFVQKEWVEGADYNKMLESAKSIKKAELNMMCNESILSGFYHMVNGVKYHFSYDMEAQGNFGDSRQILNDGTVKVVDWTVSTDDGYERILITKEDMDGLTLSVFAHKQENIKKYRDVFLPMVENAKTLEEVNNITWDMQI